MNRLQLVTRSLKHYWRTNLAVMLGVAAATAVIGGAFVVGDSVKASLRKMTLERLGKIDFALTGPRFFQENLATQIKWIAEKATRYAEWRDGEFAPAIIMQAGLEGKVGESIRRAGQVNVYGFDQRAWSMIDTSGIDLPGESGVVLNQRAAEAIHAKVGDQVTLWIELPSVVPRDTLMGNKDNDSQEVVLTVSHIAPDTSGLAKLGLQPTQAQPLNAFLDLHLLQDRLGLEEVKPAREDPLGKPARTNAILVQLGSKGSSDFQKSIAELADMTQDMLSLSDINLRIVTSKSLSGIVLESEQMILEDKLAEAAQATADEMHLITAPVMVYLANRLWNPKIYEAGKSRGYSMYSTVAGFDILASGKSKLADFQFVGAKPESLGDDDVVINEYLATDLEVKIGDTIKFTYHTVGSRGELPELERTVTVRGIVAMSGTAVDRTLTPEVKGITDVDSLADWDQPFPMKLKEVTQRDEQYWDSHRATPKMFLPLKTAKELWPSRYGSLTSLRIATDVGGPDNNESLDMLKSAFRQKLRNRIHPAEIGLMFQPVKAIGLQAASGSTDFSQLFFFFSMFLIAAAMILIGLLFRLGIEQRVRDLGLLGAVGFTAREVRRQMILEGLVITALGGVLGTILAVAYATLMVYGLTHWWVGAIGTKNLIVSVQPLSLLTGLAIALVAAILSIVWSLRQLKSLSLREQLAGVTERDADLASQQLRTRRSLRRATICFVLAGAVILLTVIRVIPTTYAFFGTGSLLLVACLSFLSGWLQTEKGIGMHGRGSAALGRLGLRNASRHRQRTVMSAGMIASAAFLIVTVAAFRRDPSVEGPVKSSGNGGYTLVAECSSPVLYDLNTEEGRKKLQLNPPADSAEAKTLAAMHVMPFRVKPGEDASCLNLYQTLVPKILGAPQSLIDSDRFAFVMGSWRDLNQQQKSKTTGKPLIPVLGDMNTLMFSLHKFVGQTIAIPNEESPQHQLIVKGMFQGSIFQGVLVMSEDNFLRLFPEQKGFRYFLIEVPPDLADAATSYLETQLSEYGFDAEPVADRLARFLSVQNTYLSTFQTLGGLGLLLGTFGLATVMLRNVLERQSELALLRAVGFQRTSVATLVLWENAFILLWGLIAGAGSAFLATAPSLFSRGADLPFSSLATLLLLVFVTGMLAATGAMISAVRMPIVTTLRGE